MHISLDRSAVDICYEAASDLVGAIIAFTCGIPHESHETQLNIGNSNHRLEFYYDLESLFGYDTQQNIYYNYYKSISNNVGSSGENGPPLGEAGSTGSDDPVNMINPSLSFLLIFLYQCRC